MPGLGDLLDRFRPVGAPGGATAAGVPVDRRAEALAELEPVFAALDRTEREAESIRARGRLQAEQTRERATTGAADIRSTARVDADAARAAAFARVRQADEAASLEGEGATDRSVAAQRRLADAALPGLVEVVLAGVAARLEHPGTAATLERP